jgi:CHAT domain
VFLSIVAKNDLLLEHPDERPAMQEMQQAPQPNNQPQPALQPLIQRQQGTGHQRGPSASGLDFGDPKGAEVEELSSNAAAEDARRLDLQNRRTEAETNKQCPEVAAKPTPNKVAQKTEYLRRVEKALRSKRFSIFAHQRKIAAGLKVYAERPVTLSPGSIEKADALQTFLKESKTHSPKPQAAATIHDVKGGAFIQIADTEGNEVFIEVPAELDPVEVARQILAGLRTGLELAAGDCDPLTIYNGACRGVNFKHVFPKRLVLRTVTSSPDGLASRVSRLANMEPLKADNTAIVSGIPSTVEETQRVFRGDATHADDWAAVAARWSEATAVAGFAAVQGTDNAVLDALVSKKNVIVLIAHADSTQLWFPAPPPEGSSLRANDLQTISDQIRANKPVVYMYCCESARCDGLQNWATELLRHGATGVYAPQGVIETENTRQLYQRFLQAAGTMDPLAALRIAERDSKCRELEMWIG